MKRLFKVTQLDPSPNSLVLREGLEIRDNQTCPAGFKLAREIFQSRIKEEDSITNVKNAVFDLGVMDLVTPPKPRMNDKAIFIPPLY
nr:hypothetical protein [Tanacetum cinerariifolium]